MSGLISGLRQWGFIMLINGKSLDADGMSKKVRRDVFNTMSEELTPEFYLEVVVQGTPLPHSNDELRQMASGRWWQATRAGLDEK